MDGATPLHLRSASRCDASARIGFGSFTAGFSLDGSLARLAQTGVDIRRLPPSELRLFAFGHWFSAIEAPPRLADLERICSFFLPELIVHEVAELAALSAATLEGIPWVTVGFGPLLQPEVADSAGEGMAPLWRGKGFRFRGKPASTSTCMSIRTRLYCRSSKSMTCRRPFAFVLPRVPRRCPFAPSADCLRYVRNGLEQRPDRSGALPSRGYGERRSADEVIATVGSDIDPAILDPLPANAEMHRFVPQDDLLPRCACVVAHGGSGTLLGALAWGKPLLLLPQFADQFYNAERAFNAGLALVLAPGEVTREAVLEGVRKLLADVSFSECAAQAQGELAAMPDVEAVLDRIEKL